MTEDREVAPVPGPEAFEERSRDARLSQAAIVMAAGAAVGGEARRVPVKRLRNWAALLYPGEAPIPSGAPLISLQLAGDTRSLDWLPDGEGGILIWGMVLSMLAGVALKDAFGVTL